MRKSILIISALLMLLTCCNGKQKVEKVVQAETEDTAANDSTAIKAQEEITSRIKELYAVIAQKAEETTERFACHTWWGTVAAVEKKDDEVEEIGFFNDDLWTQMQDTNPDEFDVRDIKFVELDTEKGTALVDFVLWSPIQTVHQKFAFCREDGDWRVHNIIRFFKDSDGKETESDLMEGMKDYLSEP